jgi:hypothetical protein
MGSNHPRRGRRKFTDEQFLRAWRNCETQRQTAMRLGVLVETVKSHAARLRAAGIDLPKQRVAW